MDALDTIDACQLRVCKPLPAEVIAAYRQLADAMDDIYGPLPPPDYNNRRPAP